MASGWLRVALGFRMVASAAATQTAEQSSILARRVQQHGFDLAGNAKQAASALSSIEHIVQQRASAIVMRDQAQSTSIIQESASKPHQPVNEPETYNNARETKKEATYESETHIKARETREKPKFEVAQTQELQEEPEPTSVSRSAPGPSFLSADSNRIRPPSSDSTQTVNMPTLERLKEGRRVPSTRVGRAAGFASLGARLAMGTASQFTSRLFGMSDSNSSVTATDANANRLAATLCRMRGAALKMGQMLSIQDESLLPPALARALEQVRQGAEAMPKYQLVKQLESQLGKDWRDKFVEFDEFPFAAASIGQVHRAKIKDDQGNEHDVVLKVQYPGVANSIESDLRNLQMLVTLTGLAPKGLFIENVIRVGRDELKVECDYIREMKNQKKFQELVASDPMLSEQRFEVPAIYEDFTTPQILAAEYAPGETIDKVAKLDQDERNRIAYNLLYLTMQELFNWRFMQTDPNWGNFLYNEPTRTTYLIDFGAAREFSKEFVDGYLRIVCANANRDEETLMAKSHEMKFLTGNENDAMKEAHKLSGFTVGEPFWSDEPFDFRGSRLSSRLSAHSSAFMEHRLVPPPEEVYTLHRKLAGAYNLCIKLGAVIPCRELLRQVVAKHEFDDGIEPPII